FGTGTDGRVLLASASADATVRVWDPLAGTAVGGPLSGHTGWVEALAFCPAQEEGPLLAAGDESGAVRLWNPLTGRLAAEPLAGHTGWVASAAFTTAPGGRLLLASGSGDRTVRLWDPRSGRCLVCLHRRCAVRAVAAAGLLLAIGDDDGVTVIELDEHLVPR